MESNNYRKHGIFYWHSKAETIIIESDINDVFESI